MKSQVQFAQEFMQINDFYAAQDGLKRPGGMVIDTAVPVRADVEAMVAWGYELMAGATVPQAIAAIRRSDEWKGKHEGEILPPVGSPLIGTLRLSS